MEKTFKRVMEVEVQFPDEIEWKEVPAVVSHVITLKDNEANKKYMEENGNKDERKEDVDGVRKEKGYVNGKEVAFAIYVNGELLFLDLIGYEIKMVIEYPYAPEGKEDEAGTRGIGSLVTKCVKCEGEESRNYSFQMTDQNLL